MVTQLICYNLINDLHYLWTVKHRVRSLWQQLLLASLLLSRDWATSTASQQQLISLVVRYVGCKFGFEWAWQRGLHPIVGISHHLFTMIACDAWSGEYQDHETNDAKIGYSHFMIRHDMKNIHIAHWPFYHLEVCISVGCRITKERIFATATLNLEPTATTLIHTLILIVDELNQWTNITFDTRPSVINWIIGLSASTEFKCSNIEFIHFIRF